MASILGDGTGPGGSGPSRCLLLLQRSLAIQLTRGPPPQVLNASQRESPKEHPADEMWMYDKGYNLFQVSQRVRWHYSELSIIYASLFAYVYMYVHRAFLSSCQPQHFSMQRSVTIPRLPTTRPPIMPTIFLSRKWTRPVIRFMRRRQGRTRRDVRMTRCSRNVAAFRYVARINRCLVSFEAFSVTLEIICKKGWST